MSVDDSPRIDPVAYAYEGKDDPLLMLASKDARPPTQADRAYQALEALYASGSLAGGSLVSESELAKLIALGRTPVREAIKRMEIDGLLIPIHRKGFVVREISIREYMYLLEVREPVETALFRAAAVRAADHHRERLHECAGMFLIARRDRNRTLVLRADYEYKLVCLDAAANPFMQNQLRSLQALARRFWNAHTSYEKRAYAMDEVTGFHLRIIEALISADHVAAENNTHTFFSFLREFAAGLAAQQVQI
ncbi:MAG: GntR family transcriptional regulator [Candidimonas sp.]|jgi:DNA-binding GntR family transcriptional regulator